MAFATHDFPFTIMDVAALLNLRIRRPKSGNRNSIYTDCPFCGDNRGKMNINPSKNVFRCNYCDESGGMIALYGKVYGISNSDAYREICDALQVGHSERPLPSQSQGAESYVANSGNVEETQDILQNADLADNKVVHQTLSLLLEMLTLSDTHRKNLHKRGLSDKQISHLGYKSTPPPYLCRSLTERLLKQGCTVQGVPGFYLGNDGKWTVKFYKRTSGMLIPVRGMDGLIRGMQIRLDVPIKDENEDKEKPGTKYLWLSSSNKNMGVTSGSPVHFVGNPFARTIYVTEGSLKADVAHCLMHRSLVAVAGANNLSQLDPIFSMLAQNGTKLIVEAHDMDKFSNKMIDKGASRIHPMAHKYGMESKRLTWNPNYKGVDDWQLALKQKREECQFTFKEQFLTGTCSFEEIETFIEAWHSNNETETTLCTYLGLTEQEYEAYIQGKDLKKLLLAQRKSRKFRIYQLDFSEETQTKPFAFLGISALRKAGYEQPPAAEYRLVHDSEQVCHVEMSDMEILNRIFLRYNDSLADDYYGRSVSPSDIIELYDNEKRQYYYRDLTGFVPIKFSPMLAKPMKTQR